ncbi:gamma-glutamyltransferase [Alteribacillus iranensis]|uniref:Gamma-glutamyltranspeptidase n=1 Tax=Alteribacillus iranensis TaxID=930128 RepID=A0A1I2BXE1_9BACI|nr:gamma-glutamyltransferase [Alteribacillus iranensis]SFE60665.1 gamma-glutamyltranspeptidase [Alteribacillus iranensis]
MVRKIAVIGIILNSVILSGIAYPQLVLSEEDSTSESVDTYDNYGVSASHPAAVEVGMEVLEEGGNAVDAAIAVSYALGVVEPYGSGIGGGGEMLLLPPGENEPIVYDYRAAAPFDENGEDKVSGIPSLVKGLDVIHQDYGLTPFEDLISPAISLAEEGFNVDYLLWERLTAASDRLPVKELPHLFPEGEAIEPGETLKQTELAETLTNIQENGPDEMYEGEISKKVTEAVPYMDQEEFERYEVKQTEPVEGKLKQGTMYSANPPLSGISVIQSLLLAEKLDIAKTKEDEDQFIHVMTEISKVTKEERLTKIGDPSYTDVDAEKLTDEEYVEELAEQISTTSPSEESVNDEEHVDDQQTDTTHFVIVDPDGMVVSATNTLSNFFGSGEYTAGFFINNSIEYFSRYADSPNKYEPGKRSRSLTAPSIFINEDRVLGIGTPGGNRIPPVMAQVLARHFYFGDPLDEAVDAKRFYGQGDTLYVEDGFEEELLADVIRKGYQFEIRKVPVYFGGIQALELDREEGAINGFADVRRSGSWDAKDKDKWKDYANVAVGVFFLLGVVFPLLHLIHSSPWFQNKTGHARQRRLEDEKGISILVPCYNEQGIIGTSLENMTSLPYSKFEVIYINDGSTDKTFSLLNQTLDLKRSSTKAPLKKISHRRVKNVYQSNIFPHIYVVDKVNGGKADALNAGIEYAKENIVITLDADTVLTENALPQVNETFEDDNVVAAGGMVHILQTKTSNPLKRLSLFHTNMLVRLQMLDFMKAFYITKASLARFDALAIISGAFGIFRKQALLEVGGYRSTIGEDIDITLRMHQYIASQTKKKVVHLKEAISYTELPENTRDFFKQRIRWQKAYMDCVLHFRSFFAKTLFTKAVSFFYIVESFLIGIVSAFVMSLFFIGNALLYPPDSYITYTLFYLSYLFLFGVFYDLAALGMNRYYGFKFQRKDLPALLVTILIDVFVYRFVLIYVVIHGTIAYFFNKDWNKVSRTGRDYQSDSKPAA